jgi:hypothetical protein
VEYWLNAKPDDPVAFAAEVAAVCAVYQHAPVVAQQGEHVISTDEKTGIQALERAAPTLPMQPGLVERVVYLPNADKYHRLTRRPSQEQKGRDERAPMASQRPSHPW